MTKILAVGLVLASLGVVGCKKNVEPAYLEGVEKASKEACECSRRPHPDRCSERAEKGLHPETGPGGASATAYEASLNAEGLGKLAAARTTAQTCLDELARNGGGGGGGGNGGRRGGRHPGGGGGNDNENNGGGGGGNGGAPPAPAPSN